jgi:hypothetical protein
MGVARARQRRRAHAHAGRFHPQNPDVLFGGGVSGGVWRSDDAGANWQPLSDDAVNLNIGALLIDQSNPDVMYAGTGELYRNSGMPWSPMAGAGIIKSLDGGQSWAPIIATQNDDFRYVADLVASPHDARRLYAATSSGVWRSDDAGAHFVQILRPADDADRVKYEGCTDLALRSDTPGDWLLATCASRSTADRYWLPDTVTPPACGSGPCAAAVFLNTDAAATALGAWCCRKGAGAHPVVDPPRQPERDLRRRRAASRRLSTATATGRATTTTRCTPYSVPTMAVQLARHACAIPTAI